jgi:hypothetical protein
MQLGRILSNACAVAMIAGCATTQQARDVQTMGLLGSDYELLRQGEEGEALVYRDSGTNWGAYNKVKLDPVTIWAGEGSAFKDFSQPDLQALADSSIHQELATDYQMVDVLGPGVLHIQVALTDAQTSNPTMDTISSVVPQAIIVSQAARLVTGKPSFVGQASAEARVSDGLSGDLLVAAVDRRSAASR